MESRYTFLYVILALVWIFPVTLLAQKENTPSTLPKEETDEYKQKVTDIVSFLEGTLNFIGDRSNPVREKEVIFQESYLKMFRDPDIQVEDDLDEAREVVLYKDVQAYLKDIGFFFRQVRFRFDVQDISIFTNESGAPYFRVTVNRNLRGITVDDDSVNTNKVRYIEINLDEANSELKIVSIYTTKPNEREELRTWWNSLGEEWRQVLGADVQINDTLRLADIALIMDSLVIVRNMETPLNTGPVIGQIKRIIQSTAIDIQGRTTIYSLEPLSHLSDLKSINCAGTMASDLTPLRNLGSLEVLDCSGTLINSVQPLYYCIHLKELRLSQNRISDLTTLENLTKIEKLDLSLNPVTSVASLSGLTALRDLRLRKTRIENLAPLGGLKNLEYLDISKTRVASLSPLSGCQALRILAADSTGIKSLEPLKNLAALQLIYCDQSGINRNIADAFMGLRPGVMVIFESGELIGWWNAMDQPWQQVFRKTDKLDATPTKEQLHQLIRKESLSIRKI
ncbi:MAG: leucine-rich repeat domain-containing protein, partial [Bacteroidetes bacterium]|nr:leucine-rich repeat domain-containing protein [Bacteroidota bacterium]